MGGPGAGHKSWRARQSRLVNMAKARAARRRAPLPWRSGLESRIIEQLVYQWWLSTEPRKWAKYKVARLLGVSHTWVNKLVKRFRADPGRARRRLAAFSPATFDKLQRAREETRRQREMGWLRGPIRLRRVKFLLWGKKTSVTVLTRSEKLRREAAAQVRQAQCQSRQAGARGHWPSPTPVPYADLPLWARGLLLPAGPGPTPSRIFRHGIRRS
ncbi:MAG TPA: hypothetical protein VJN21_02860 [Candidatus Acidoferrales bacterium]|nr:hypothetical protein [Candidatus Acidoferrales bacterium]